MTGFSSLPYDVLHQLCACIPTPRTSDLRSLSLVNKIARDACVPHLFQSMFVSMTGSMADLSYWNDIGHHFETMRDNQGIVRSIRTLHLEACFSRCAAPERLPEALFSFLFSIKQLESLTLLLDSRYEGQLRQALDEHWSRDDATTFVAFPHVKSLKVTSPDWILLIEECSPLRQLRIHQASRDAASPSINFANLATVQPSLISLHCGEPVDVELIHGIATHFPLLEDLGFCGTFRCQATDIVKELTSLPHLKTIDFPSPVKLGMGYHISGFGRASAPKRFNQTIDRLVKAVEQTLLTQEGCQLYEMIITNSATQMVWTRDDGKLIKAKMRVRVGPSSQTWI